MLPRSNIGVKHLEIEQQLVTHPHADDACAVQQRTEQLGLRLTARDLNDNKLVRGTHR